MLVVLLCWALIDIVLFIIGLPLVTIITIIVCPFVVGVGVVLSHPVVLLVWLSFRFFIVASPCLCSATCLFPPCKQLLAAVRCW